MKIWQLRLAEFAYRRWKYDPAANYHHWIGEAIMSWNNIPRKTWSMSNIIGWASR